MFPKADPNLPVVMESYWATKTRRSVVDRINAAFRALAIQAGIVGNVYDRKVSPFQVGGHLVTLASDIPATCDSQNYGRNYIGEVLTWGGKRRIVFRSDQLIQAILGCVATDLTGFSAGGGQGRPGVV